jgi:hypothetical protein
MSRMSTRPGRGLERRQMVARHLQRGGPNGSLNQPAFTGHSPGFPPIVTTTIASCRDPSRIFRNVASPFGAMRVQPIG